jgi:integrase
MEIKEAIYNYDKIISSLKGRIEKDVVISQKNKELIAEYHNYAVARGLSKARQSIILQSLLRLALASKADFNKAQRRDIEELMAEFQEKKYSPWTIETSKAILKQFYKWLLKVEKGDPLPDCVRWMEGGAPKNNLTKSDLLTKDDISRIIGSTTDLMQKALISVHFEACNRPGETLSMTIGDVVFKEDYALVCVTGKTGQGEKFVLQSYDLLRAWIDTHPFKNDPKHGLWIVSNHIRGRDGRDLYGKPISLAYLGKIFKTAAKRAGIVKRTYSYLYRHSAGTYYYAKIGEALAKKQMLHAPNTKMAGTYNHLSSEDLLAGLRKSQGIETKEEEQIETCWKCHHPNGFGVKTCSRCASPLNREAAEQKRRADTNVKRDLENMQQKIAELSTALSNIASQQGKNIQTGGFDISASGCMPLSNDGPFIPNKYWQKPKEKY